MSALRIERVNEEMKKAIGEVLMREVKDPRINRLCTIIRVNVTNDFEHAKVMVSIICDDDETEEIMQGLKRASGFISRQVNKKVKLRRTPKLEFIKDDSAAYAVRMSKMISDVMSEIKEEGQDDE